MTSVTGICNIALAAVGEGSIIDIDDAEEKARRCKLLFDDVRDAVTRAHPWNAATELASVAADGTPPAFGFANAFTLPTDPFCLRVWRMQNVDTIFKVRGRKIHSDAKGPLNFEYIKQVTDPAELDALMVQAIALRLAHSLTYRITNSRTLRADIWNDYKDILAEARSIDGQEGTPEEFEVDDFLSARF